jgi:hypothetical protein
MKKLILSAFAVACMFAGAANAQLVGIGAHDDFGFYGDPVYNPEGSLGGGVGGIYWFKDGNPANDHYTFGTRNGELQVDVDKPGGVWSVIGVGFGDSNGDGTGTPYYLDVSGNPILSFKVKASLAPYVAVKIEDAAGHELALTHDTAAVNPWTKKRAEITLGTLTEEYQTVTFNITPSVQGSTNTYWVADPVQDCSKASTCPSIDFAGTAAFDLEKITKIVLLVSGEAAYTGAITFDDFQIGTIPSTPGINGRLLGKVTDADNTELVSPTGSYSFGSVLITGTGSEKVFTIHNSGSLPLNITSIELEGTDEALFTLSNIPTSVAANGTATFNVTFAPTVASPSAYNAAVRIKNDSWDSQKSEYVFSLNGTGTEDAFVQIVVAEGTTDLTAGGTLAFAIENAGETASKTVTIKNTGTADLTISDIALSGTDAADFTVSPSSLSPIAPGASATLTIEFSTVATGDKEATLTITSDDAVTPSVAIDLTGKIEATTSISKILAENTVVSPNPFAQDFTVSLGSNISGSVNLTVRNAHGAAVKTLSNVSGSEEISLTGLGAGIYYLEIASEGGVAVKKVVKQ